MDIKIVDVANRAGVSPATVSRVLNGNSYVKAKTRDKVLQAIADMGYHPNAFAKNLRSQKAMTIGVIVPDINSSYYAEIIKGIENMAYSLKYRLIICDAQNQASKEQEYLSLLLSRTVDGMILTTPQTSAEEIARYSDKGCFIAVIGRHLDHPKIPCIYTDNIKFSKEVVRHLVGQGHRSIAFLSGYAEAVDSFERLEGYAEGLKEHGIPLRSELIENGNFNETGGYEAMRRLLAKDVPFTAVYAANDEMALGVYRACREAGLRIPEQLAVVGVDNNRISRYLSPTLTTVDQPKYTMGAVIAEKLIDQLNADEFNDKRTFKVDSQLLVRGSTVPSLE